MGVSNGQLPSQLHIQESHQWACSRFLKSAMKGRLLTSLQNAMLGVLKLWHKPVRGWFLVDCMLRIALLLVLSSMLGMVQWRMHLGGLLRVIGTGKYAHGQHK